MDWTRLTLKTLLSQFPKLINSNFTIFERAIDVFYDEDNAILIKPLNTSGRVKASGGEFVNMVVDNLTVKRQFTNLYENSTTSDMDYVNTYNGNDVSTRLASSDPSSLLYDPSSLVWPLEPSIYSYIDVQTPYIKISNTLDYGLQNNNIGKEVQIIFDSSISSASTFRVLLNISETKYTELRVDPLDTIIYPPLEYKKTWIKLITTSWDASYGPTWVVKEGSPNYSINDINL